LYLSLNSTGVIQSTSSCEEDRDGEDEGDDEGDNEDDEVEEGRETRLQLLHTVRTFKYFDSFTSDEDAIP